MSYPRIIERVYSAPVCITPAAWGSIHAFLLPRLTGQAPALEPVAAAVEARSPYTGKRQQKARPRQVDARSGAVMDPRLYTDAGPGVAGIPIYGVLAKNLSAWEESCGGGTDINAIEMALQQAAEDPEVRAILLDIDSPGGEVTAIPELAAAIREISAVKPTVAFTDAAMCSAAYWLGSQAGEVYCTQSAHVGSIGTYLAWLDPTVRMQLEGTQLQLFKAGAHKAIGLPGRPLTEEDRALLQARVNEINGWFTTAVKAARPDIAASSMEGQSFTGPEALAKRLVDGLLPSYEAAARALAESVAL